MAREREVRYRVERKHFELRHLGTGLELLAVDEAAAVPEPDHARGVRLGDVVDADQTGDVHGGADLLTAFAHSRVERALVVIDEPARQAPQPAAGLDPAPPEQDSSRSLHDDSGHHLRVVPEDEVVVGARLVHPALDLARHELRSAVDAEVGHAHQPTVRR
jgi:hypothetical protein